MDDDLPTPSAAEYRERSERARAQARSRYRDHLTEVLGGRGVEEAAAVADVVLDALTEWRYIDTGERCTCSCHPRLPDGDLHDYGFDCVCTRTREQRSTSFQRALNEIHDVWDRGDQRSQAPQQAAEAELRDWLSTRPGVTVYSHGGWAGDQWRGDVDGRSFHFRDRPDGWYLEIDLQPTGHFVDAIDGRNDDGTTRYRRRELQDGDIIATGTSYAEGCGTTVVQRAQFIVNTVRVHLRRRDCAHHPGALDSISLMLGTGVRWCPGCGTQLKAH